jgi:hypothetical protein
MFTGTYGMVKNDPGASHLNVVLNWFDELTRARAK